MNGFYTDYGEYMGRFFPGRKVQKISVNTGAGCPNRDGTIGTGGCIYCNNESFTPAYCFETKSITEQIEAGKKFFGKKYPDMQYLAYFQSFTNTYRKAAEDLKRDFTEALKCDGVVGLIVGTRPDCIDQDVAEMLASLNKSKPVFVELGIETMHDSTLQLINRGHDSAASRDAILRLARLGLHVGVHLIAGLPGEDEPMLFETVEKICNLPVESIKLHHLQILRGTRLGTLFEKEEIDFKTFSAEEYLELCIRLIDAIPRHLCIERFMASAPPEMVMSPKWGLKNHEFTNLLHNRLAQRESQLKRDAGKLL